MNTPRTHGLRLAVAALCLTRAAPASPLPASATVNTPGERGHILNQTLLTRDQSR